MKNYLFKICSMCMVLLVAFLEKSTSDYQNAMRTASSRLKWLKS